ncbi:MULTISPECIES: sacsin N-terminal ATP-binding-like domain-containing protein [unclassified Janthinobacterium]|uniref:sacsin N-terminal ATP-binding-like domain-containing protein n=1 Tax=unclassified Janthinobacterium TaxID=2610881 RepID=UPI00088444F4|nr:MULTISPECIES: DUF3883 domain-containing protein [unclassified Janthinobacterium]SDA53981.1 protein of unknown function [Janthinobacterium sp. 551a]SFB45351.1 protein of unknown function [Janthinobacterium sp. 344]
MDETLIQAEDGYTEKLVSTVATKLTSAAVLINSVTRSQLEHALDGHRRGLKVYESLRSLNEIIGTQYGDRVLFELLQNAHDAHAVGEQGEVAIHLVVANDDSGLLLVANKGRPFSDSNFEAIRNIGTSDKEIGEGIGNKGLGFRSVEALTNDVHIFSASAQMPAPMFDGYCFRFASTEEIAEFLEEIGASQKMAAKVAADVPRYLVPVAVTEQSDAVRRLASLGYATVICLPLASSREVALAEKQVAALTNAAAPVQLFLDRLASLEVMIVRAGVEIEKVTLSREVEPLLRHPSSSIRMQRVTLSDRSAFLVVSQTLHKEAVLAAVAKSIPAAPPLKRWLNWKGDADVSIAVCLDRALAPRLYNFLPMDDHAISPMSGHIDAPFFADIDRRTIKTDLPLNKLLIEAAADTAAKACLAIVDEDLAVPFSAVVDMAAWSGPRMVTIIEAFRALGRPITDAAIWPATSSEGVKWAPLRSLYAWPDVRTRQMTPSRLESIANAHILASISDDQLSRIRALASAVSMPLELHAQQLCVWVEAMAEYLFSKKKKAITSAWRDFYQDVLTIFVASKTDLAALVGKKVLLGDNKLLVATADSLDDAPPVFARMTGKRGKRTQQPPNPPSAIARKFRFLNPYVEVPEDIINKFEKAGLLRHYDPVEALAALNGALEYGTDNQRQEALTWAFRVWLATGEASVETALRQAELCVPCLGGWMRAEDALMSSSWSIIGRTLEQYFDEAAAVSLDCKVQRNRLLIAFSNWPRARADDRREDWTRFLQILRVKDGLEPIAANLRRTGTPNGYWSSFLRAGNLKLGFDKTWTTYASRHILHYPQTEYSMHDEAWRVPGQLEHDHLSNSAKEALSNLLVAYLRVHGQEHFEFDIRSWHGRQSVTLPTPLYVFLRHGGWPASARSDEVVFARPCDSWSTTVLRQHPPRFVARFKSEPGTREELPPILFDPKIGLRDWSHPSSAPSRLASLAAVLPDLSAAERRDLRDQVRRSWADVVQSRSALPPSLQLIVERAGSLEVLQGLEQDPPVVYVTSEPQAFAARALSDAGEAVLDVGETDAPLICELLRATGRFFPQLTDSGEVQLVVDGVPFEALPDAPPLVAGELSWLSDVAVMAHEHLGDPLEMRTLPSDELDRRLRAIRVKRCSEFSLTISGLDIPVRGRERVHAVQHARIPTLLVRTNGLIDLQLLLEASQALTKLLGSRRNTLELLLGRLQRDGFRGGVEGPSEDMLASAIGRDVGVVREHFAATKGGVQRRVDAVLPAVAYLKDLEAAERLRERHAQLGTALQLRAWLEGELQVELANQLLEVVAETDDQRAICVRLNLNFAAFSCALTELGYPPINDEADFRRLFSAYLAELAPLIRARLRRAFLPAWQAAAPLDEYVTLRTLEFIQFDPQWLLQLEQLDQARVVAHANQAVEARLGADDPAVELEDLEVVVAANRKHVTARHAELTNLIRAWCRKNGAQQSTNLDTTDAQQLVRKLDQAGLLDFELIEPDALPALLRRASWWPANMPTTEALHDLGLTAEDLKQEEREAREIKLKAEVTRRSILFAGRSLDTGGPNFILEFENLADEAIAQSNEWFTRSRIARLLQQEDAGNPQRGSSGGGGGKGGNWRNQPSDAIRTAMGMASEWLAWKLLFLRHPKEMSDECWVSSNREKFCTGPAGDDSLGYDFRVVTARHEYLYEVKSALDAGGEFELTARELEVAGSAREDRKRKYRILYVPFVFDPTRWNVKTLPNPVGTKTRDQFRVVRSGSVRYRFEQR